MKLFISSARSTPGVSTSHRFSPSVCKLRFSKISRRTPHGCTAAEVVDYRSRDLHNRRSFESDPTSLYISILSRSISLIFTYLFLTLAPTQRQFVPIPIRFLNLRLSAVNFCLSVSPRDLASWEGQMYFPRLPFDPANHSGNTVRTLT